ncbi:hypothetical protein HYT56_02655 [Candidatus Woesearchaeota archaeon]|nr:hypothetical protein [Candidatus Woesearchaeota archaeon]
MSSKRRKKQLEKRIEGFEKQIERHEGFIETMRGRLDATKNYWRKEINRFRDKKELAKEKLKKLKGK